ncbi:hypothetical protein [Thalassotalea agarivorans]|uniref:Swiss Army Knife 2H phosphoesterase domain-containing protein n=2 Tax=Thalassotalea agarivorans TaxID=349064 RepID=A0A1I0DJ14_THASX|nr:hypothetical protein [Thalassotalea agarivorans]SET32058.1 hypothetical protein SAMN05660429_01528 [Thalassotalea agarivorans]
MDTLLKAAITTLALSWCSFVYALHSEQEAAKSESQPATSKTAQQQAKNTQPGVRALARYAEEKQIVEQQELLMKTLQLTPKELVDNFGQKYIGMIVPQPVLIPFLDQFKSLEPDTYAALRRNQIGRDHNLFHVTLVTPPEYKHIDKALLQSLQQQAITVNLIGLGKVAQGASTAYFVVAESSEGQFYRQSLVLGQKDFHVTLGFSPHDIYNTAKNRSTLIFTPPQSDINIPSRN